MSKTMYLGIAGVGILAGTGIFWHGGVVQTRISVGPEPLEIGHQACKGKAKGAPCAFTSPKGDDFAGQCDTPPNGSFSCVMDGQPGQAQINVCKGKAKGTPCAFTSARGLHFKGLCGSPPEGLFLCSMR